MKRWLLTCLLACVALILVLANCSDDDTTKSTTNTKTYTYDATACDPLVITVAANQSIMITATDSVHTNPSGTVDGCDLWTDADGLPDCEYVGTVSEIHNLSFMALIGNFDGEWFLVGKNFDTTFTTAGELSLQVNDWGPCAENSDNAGQFVITVTKE